jgi:VCBS repeat-containing protein
MFTFYQNRAPVVNADIVNMAEDSSIAIDVLDNDSDYLGDVTASNIISVSRPAHGTTTLNIDGKIIYTPTANFNGTDSFTYTLRDSEGLQSNGTVTVNVTPLNDSPVVSSAIAMQTARANTAFNFTIPGNSFLDIDGDSLSYSVTRADGTPIPAWLSFNPATNTLSGK